MDQAETVRIGSQVLAATKGGPVVLDPGSSTPALSLQRRPRWKPSLEHLGIVERLARARYAVPKPSPAEPELWSDLLTPSKESEVLAPIAQSVWASSEIEGESIYVEDVPLAIVGKPGNIETNLPDYQQRRLGTKAVYDAYVWALTQPFPLAGRKVISPEFVSELHQRMFESTKPDAAGRLKQVTNKVQWSQPGGKVELVMLPPSKAPEFLERLCDRLNACFAVAETTGRCCRLTSVAEFVVDFLAIHPFRDGNGRTARLLSTYLLERAGYHFARFYSLDAIILERKQAYYKALYDAQRNWYLETEDLTAWIDFYLDAVFNQWLRAHQTINDEHRRSA